MLQESVEKINNKHVCEKCNYSTSRKSSYEKHIATRKHNRLIMANNEVTGKEHLHICSKCNKAYKSRVGLWKHNKVCNILLNHIVYNKSIENIIITDMNNINDVTALTNLVIEVVKTIVNYKTVNGIQI